MPYTVHWNSQSSKRELLLIEVLSLFDSFHYCYNIIDYSFKDILTCIYFILAECDLCLIATNKFTHALAIKGE